jgi:drug/metabolite transporter (DMT)-like permease
MRSPLATILPLCSAIGYTFAALMVKRASTGTRSPWRTAFIINLCMGLLFQPWLLLGGNPFAWKHLLHAALAGATFFIGQVFTFIALSRGDVSLTTPVLGTKVLFVALFAFLFSGEDLTPRMLAATGLTALAMMLLGAEGKADRSRVLPSLLFGFLAAVAYAGTDIIQQIWVAEWGFGYFAPAMFATIALLSLTFIPLFEAPLHHLPAANAKWAAAAGCTLALQATGIATSIAFFHEVTTTNILYNTRGIWSIIVVWSVGHWFGNKERQLGKRIMLQRLAGALLLLAAVALALTATPPR